MKKTNKSSGQKKKTPKFNWIMAHFAVTMEIWPSPLGLRAPKIHPWNPQEKRTQIWMSLVSSCSVVDEFKILFFTAVGFFPLKVHHLGQEEPRPAPMCTTRSGGRSNFGSASRASFVVGFHWDENSNTENVRNKKNLQKQSKSPGPCFFEAKLKWVF